MPIRWVPPLSDGEIIRKMKILKENYPELTGQLQGTGFVIDTGALDSEIAKQVLKSNGFAVNNWGVNFAQISITYNTNSPDRPTSLVQLSDSLNSNQGSHPRQIEFLLELSKAFANLPRNSSELSGEDAIASKFLRIENALSGAVERFEELQTSFVEKNQKLRDEHEVAVNNLKDQIASEKKELEEDNQRKRDEIEQVRKELDDRSNTHARRAIRNEIKTSIAESLGKSVYAKQTLSSKLFIRCVYVLAIALLSGLAVWSTILFSDVATSDKVLTTSIWIAGGKATISTLSALGLTLLFLKWEVSWLNQQASFERVLSSTKVDIDRASWVAESLLEWNRESPGKEVPHELLLSFTRRLFDWDAKLEDNQSATDSLASAILGSASKLQIGPNGANIELDSKSIRKLDKS